MVCSKADLVLHEPGERVHHDDDNDDELATLRLRGGLRQLGEWLVDSEEAVVLHQHR